MIARVWFGKTRAADAETYAAYLRATGVRDLLSTEGNRGVFLLRRLEGERATFGVISLWGSLDDVRRFAGDEPERPVYYPEDDRYLLSRSPTVEHFEVLEAPPLAG